MGKAQLDLQNLPACIEAFIKANDPCMFERVIFLSQTNNDYTDLVNYLLMARKSIKDTRIDSELVYAYAKNNESFLPELEAFVQDPNQADLQKCGDRCFDDRLYLAAEILFKRIQNN